VIEISAVSFLAMVLGSLSSSIVGRFVSCNPVTPDPYSQKN